MFGFFRRFLLASACFASLSMSVLAAPVTQVIVPIADDQRDMIEPLFEQALVTVLIRLTGDPQVAQHPAVIEFLKTPKSFLEEYKQEAQPPQLNASFNQAAIEQALAKAGIAYWSNKRPVIMTWWLSDNTLMGDSQAGIESIQQAANEQGLSVRLPLADLTEQSLADKATFDEQDSTIIRKASAKYAGNVVLIVHSQALENKWHLKWHLWLSSTDKKSLADGNIEAATLEQASSALFAKVNPALAKVYVVKASQVKEYEVIVKDIDFNRYIQVGEVLSSFNGRLIEASGQKVRYQVTADLNQLKAQLGLIHLHQDVSAETAEKEGQIPMLIFHP